MDAMSSAQREAYIIDRRAGRATFRQIGRELGISATRVHGIWVKVVDRLPAQKLDQMRAEEAELIDRAVSNLLAIAEDTTVSARSRAEAWNSIRGWCERRAKMFGLDAPSRRETTVITADAITAEIEKLTAEMAWDASKSGIDLPEVN